MTEQATINQTEIEGNEVCDCPADTDNEIIIQFSRMIIKCLGCGNLFLTDTLCGKF